MKFAASIFLAMLLTLGAGLSAYAETSPEEKEQNERIDLKQAEKDVTVKALKGEILVTASKPVQVKVFNILGRLVSDESVQAGTTRIQLPAHGVYIVKAGEQTSKVAV